MDKQLEHLSSKYGAPRQLTLELPSLDFPPVSRRRHGEVCMAILRPSGGFLLQTKASYPGSVMRLPTGGIQKGEAIEDALLREIWEETNLEVDVARFVASIRYSDSKRVSRFCTYLFFTRETSGVLQSNDPGEKITEWVEAKPAELPDYASKLRDIVPSWSNWGRFRAMAMDVLLEDCNNHGL